MRYRLLLADDEALEREGIERMIKDAFGDMFQIFQAKNGREAIQLAEQERPDLLFMDIKMPGIHGLEAIAEIRKHLPLSKVVLVSAYDYFSYAKEALQLGVKAYILKPAKKDQIVQILQQLTKELDEERSKREEELALRERWQQVMPLVENEFSLLMMIDSVHEFDVQQMAQLLGFTAPNAYAMVISFPLPEKEGLSNFQMQKRSIYEAVRSAVKTERNGIVSPLLGNHMAVLLPWEHATTTYRTEAIELAKRLQRTLERQLEFVPVVGIGNCYQGAHQLRQSYQEAVLVASDLINEVSVRFYADIRIESRWEGFTVEEEQRLMDSLNQMDEAQTLHLFGDMFSRLSRATQRNEQICRNEVIGLFHAISRQLFRMGFPFDGTVSLPENVDVEWIDSWAKQRLKQLIDRIRQERVQHHTKVIDRVRMILHEGFADEVTLEGVAEAVHLNPFYLSKLFKSQVGETFIDYLTNLRIDRAKQLMHLPDISMKEVCFQVGYRDPNYFSRVFRKVTGMSPSEYRQIQIGNRES